MPEVSVIIPTYNRASLLPRTLGSVFSQSYSDFEVIVIDDGSTDNTQEVIGKFRDERLGYVKLVGNSGRSSKPRNIGILNARGKYIALLDSDDEWLPSFLIKLVDKIKQTPSTVGVVHCGTIVEFSNGKRSYIAHSRQRGKIYPKILEYCGSTVTASLIKRECFNKVGLFDESATCDDHWDMWIRLGKAYEFDYVPEALAKYHRHTIQQSRINESLRMKAVLKRYDGDYAQYPMQAGKVRFRIGLVCLGEGHRREAFKYIVPNLRYSWRVFVDLWHTYETPSGNRLLPLLSILAERL